MEENESLSRAINENVEIVTYDSAWPDRYEAERLRLLELLPGIFSAIEHVGSTSVTGLPAKPIIDIIAAVPSMKIADNLIPILCANGYSTSKEFNATLKDSRWLMRHSGGRRTHHLHLVLEKSEHWKSKIQFRDVLRTNATVRAAYLNLKQQLKQNLGQDREAYTEAKGDFIQAALKPKAVPEA